MAPTRTGGEALRCAPQPFLTRSPSGLRRGRLGLDRDLLGLDLGLLRDGDREDALLERGAQLVHLGAIGEREAPREGPVVSLVRVVPLRLLLLLVLALAAHVQTIAGHRHLEVLLP